MANQNGQVYGLTILSPILEDESLDICHSMELRWYLGHLPRDHNSPFAQISSTYLARLVVMDDVVYVGAPACEEHLKSRYLVFETNFDGDLETYLTRMARETPEFVEAVWKHCVGYPGLSDTAAFLRYMKQCQIATTFFFADVNNRTVQQSLKALQTQSALAHFIEQHQAKAPGEIQREFGALLESMMHAPLPLPGGDESERMPQENRPHE
ncbi:MAG: hypothetical protein ACR2JB_04545 [Bryobacteraceae bacterium]